MQQGYKSDIKRMNFWNQKEIAKPPNYTLEYTAEERQNNNTDECITSLKSALSNLENILQNDTLQRFFFLEAKILVRMLPTTRRHRVEKFYGQLKKIHRCVKHWYEMKLNEFAANLSEMMPSTEEKLRSVRIPSKQMFEYLMLRIFGAYQLFVALESCCRETAQLLLARCTIGHQYWTSFTLLAVLARLRILSLDFAGQLARTYDDIYPWMMHLKGTFLWDFILENPPSLVASLRIHSKNAVMDDNIKEIRQSGLVASELNVLNIFDDRENVEPVNKMISGNQEKLDTELEEFSVRHVKKKSKKCKSGICSDYKEEPKKRVANGSKSAGKQLKPVEEEEILTLLSLFDEDVNGKSCDLTVDRHNSLKMVKLDLENNYLYQESNGIVGSDEDIGEIAEKEVLVNTKNKKKKRNENKSNGSTKSKKRKLLDEKITKCSVDNSSSIKFRKQKVKSVKQKVKSVKQKVKSVKREVKSVKQRKSKKSMKMIV